ncbi:MAG: hypothetical protein ABIE22_04665 [archaeon]
MADFRDYTELEEARKDALHSGNARLYFAYSQVLGLDPVEDPELAAEGERELKISGYGDLEFELMLPEHGEALNEHLGEKREHLGRIAEVALRRFPELQRGESISVREIKKRLGEIRNTGYDVKAYSKMGKEEAWTYLQEIKEDIRFNCRMYCPYKLKEISRKNMAQKEQADSCR